MNKPNIDWTKFKETVKIHTPPAISGLGIAFSMLEIGINIGSKKMQEASATYLSSEDVYIKYRDFAIRYQKSNNWLKIHGYPMRRKSLC